MVHVRGYVATTDIEWFKSLRARGPLDEVNFWQPSAHGFAQPAGTPFFFKLKKPHYKIGGFGIFARYETATPRLAWEAFAEKNGTRTYDEMAGRIARYVGKPVSGSHRIGCIMIGDPVFFADEDWVAQPSDWHRNVVSASPLRPRLRDGDPTIRRGSPLGRGVGERTRLLRDAGS